MSDQAFPLLAEPIQRILWDMKWTALRPIQVEAIREIMMTNRDLLIAASTASGKTEAAFLPTLSKIVECRTPSIQALYVGPLKALINDQFLRLERLCEHAKIPVHRWHGDVDGGKKKRLVKEPRGVLLITPESIESLFVNHSSAVCRMFSNLEFVVIDEVHAFVGSERGTHLRSLLARIQGHTNSDVRMIALSATLGKLESYAAWLRPQEPDRIRIIEDRESKKTVQYRIFGYMRRVTGSGESEVEPKSHTPADDLISDCFSAHRGTKNLIFTNSKATAETLTDRLNRKCQQTGVPLEFLVHHGSLSKEIREHVEDTMRTASRPYTTICSPTLELGIDIGNVVAVGQIGPCWSVSSLIQRLGRSGRRDDEPSVMRLYVEEDEATERSNLVDQLYPSLVQAIASTELMLKGWVEPPDTGQLDLSTFVQQILSVVTETGGIRADRLFDRLVVRGAFNLDQKLFAEILRSIATKDLIEQMPEGDIILGVKGQRIVEQFDFYSAFMGGEEFRVVHGGTPIGSLPAATVPNVDDHLLLAGRRWAIVQVDQDRRVILVRPAKGSKAPIFGGSAGEIHSRIRESMREVLIGNQPYSYLNDGAHAILQRARRTAIDIDLAHTRLIALGKKACIWFTFTGTRTQRTLELMAKLGGIHAVDRGIALHVSASAEETRQAMLQIASRPPSEKVIVKEIRYKRVRKYDWYLTDSLLDRGLATSAIDIQGALGSIRLLQI